MRPWRESDAPVLYKWASDPDVGPHAGGTVMEKNGFLPTGQMVIYEKLHQGNGRPIRVMRLEVR